MVERWRLGGVKVWTLRRRGWEVETGRGEGVDPEEAWLGGGDWEG